MRRGSSCSARSGLRVATDREAAGADFTRGRLKIPIGLHMNKAPPCARSRLNTIVDSVAYKKRLLCYIPHPAVWQFVPLTVRSACPVLPILDLGRLKFAF